MQDIIRTKAENMSIKHNVSFQVIDTGTNKVVQEVEGHNSATNSLLIGLAHYLTGDGVFNQGIHMLSNYIPRYISLGTMGLINQDQDVEGLPAGIGVADGDEETRFKNYMHQVPGYGADGYDLNDNNNRTDTSPLLAGIGPPFARRGEVGAPIIKRIPIIDYPVCPRQLVCTPAEADAYNCKYKTICPVYLGTNTPDPIYDDIYSTVRCELISNTFPRAEISYRDIVPETQSELPRTIDVVFSAMISTGALAQFREPDKDYIFITEAGLWSKKDWIDGGDNGLLAGYRIAPSNKINWDMSIEANRKILKQNILKVGRNQVVVVIWKIQLGALEQLIKQ